MDVSVVIPAYNEESNIAKCIQSIQKNTVKPLEIIVCDGRSEDRTAEIARENGATVLDNPERTAAAGRNVGISNASGEIIAFTDGDCEVDSRWIENIVKEFRDGSLDGLGGRTVPMPGNMVENFWGHLSLEVIMNFPDESYYVKERSLNDAFITANCAYRKSTLERIGGFDPWFGNNAEDVDLSWRMLKDGAKLLYTPDMIVTSRSPSTIRSMCRKSYRNGVSSTKLQKRHSGERKSFDKRLYPMLIRSSLGPLTFNREKTLLFLELSSHLWGKLVSSIRYRYPNM